MREINLFNRIEDKEKETLLKCMETQRKTYEKIIRPCEGACEFHNQIIVNLLEIISTKNIYLMRKIKYLSKRSIREKLLSFLSEQAQMNNSNAFEIKFDRQELADYLSVDRSAMSKELSKLKKEHILNYRKNWFQLLE